MILLKTLIRVDHSKFQLFSCVTHHIISTLVVSGTIAPSRDLPDLTAEDTIRIILSNLNLIVPVVAAVLVIIIAIIVICILRSKGNHHKGIFLTNFSYFFSLSLPVPPTIVNMCSLSTSTKIYEKNKKKNYTNTLNKNYNNNLCASILGLWCMNTGLKMNGYVWYLNENANGATVLRRTDECQWKPRNITTTTNWRNQSYHCPTGRR